MESSNWDPLEHNLSGELLSAARRRQIQNILKSYTGWFDPFSELIQNSLDAIEKRAKKDESIDPHIWIKIDLEKNLISITDNGIGFESEQFRSFLAPSISFKKQSDRGNKGVGATYLAYGFNHLEIGTKTPDFRYLGVLKRGREWVEDDASIQTRPKINSQTNPSHLPFDGIDRGSTFTLKLEGNYVRPSDLGWMGANDASQWESILRIKTPLGGVYGEHTGRYSDFECTIEVVDSDGRSTNTHTDSCEYLYPHKVISSCRSLNDIRKEQKKRLSKGLDPGKLPSRFYKLNGLYKTWSYEDFTDDGAELEGRLDSDQEDLAKKYQMEAYGFFCYSTDIWDYFNDDKLGIRKGKRVLRGGLQLSTNSMPQGELKVIPLKRNIGYQNTSHVIVHFEEADPDLGRKGFQPELEQLGQDVSRLLVNQFMNYRELLKSETGAPPDITAEKEVHEWISEQEKHEEENELCIDREDVFLPQKRASMTSIPRNEQDTVSLFNQLLAGGVIRGVELMAASTHKQYDGVCKLSMRPPLDNHIFDVDENPLGVEESNVKDFLSNPKIIEYKYSVDALIKEFGKEDKNQKDIGLVVAWEMGDKWEERYDITPLLHMDNVHHRYFHGATHIANSAMSSDSVFPMIILSELVDYINDPLSVQELQVSKYMSV